MSNSQHQGYFDADWQSSCGSLLETNKYLLTTGKHSDVTFVVGIWKEKIQAHTYILKSRSSVFEAMFKRWNNKKSIVVVDGTTVSAFNHFLQYVYTNEFNAGIQDARELFLLAHQYNMKDLANRCLELMKTQINMKSSVGIYQIANELNQLALKQQALEFMLKNAHSLLEKISATMTEETLLNIIQSNGLQAQEIHVFKAVVRWAELTCMQAGLKLTAKNKRRVSARLVPFIRFKLMTMEDFTTEVVTKNQGFLTQQEILKIFVHFSGSTLNQNGKSHQNRIPYAEYSVPTFTQTYDHHWLMIMGLLTFTVDMDIYVTSLRIDLRNHPYFSPTVNGQPVADAHHYMNGFPYTLSLYVSGSGKLDRIGFFIPQFGLLDDLSSVEFKCDWPIILSGHAYSNYHFVFELNDKSNASNNGTSEVITSEVVTTDGKRRIIFKFFTSDKMKTSGEILKINFILRDHDAFYFYNIVDFIRKKLKMMQEILVTTIVFLTIAALIAFILYVVIAIAIFVIAVVVFVIVTIVLLIYLAYLKLNAVGMGS